MGISWEIMAFWQVEKGHSNGVYHVISQLMEHFMGYHGHIYIYIYMYINIYIHIFMYIYIYVYFDSPQKNMSPFAGYGYLPCIAKN